MASNSDKIERAREASAVEALVRPYILDQVTSTVKLMIAQYRGQKLTEHFMVGKIAELSCYQGMLDDLESRQRVGDAAAQEEYRDAEKASRIWPSR